MAKSSGSKSLNLAKRAQRNAKQQALKSLALKTAKSGLLSSAIKPAKTMTLSEGLTSARQALMDALAREPSGQLLHVFISLTDGSQRAKVVKASGYKLDDLWLNLTEQLQHRYGSTKAVRWLRVDWARHIEASTWADLALELKKHKRNYFRKGIALDAEMDVAFLEQEINANAMLYAGNSVPHAQVNQANFARYAKQRYSNKLAVNFEPSQPVYTFTTQAILIEANKPFFKLYDYAQSSGGRHTGRRVIERLDAPAVETLINDASQFLAAQVQENGSFIYGLHPCFDREINTYNTLRHTSSIYSMLEAWEITRSKTLKRAIDNALKYLTTKLLRTWTHKEESVTYLVEINNEIKLGGSGVALLALSKYTELTEDKRYLPLMEQIALGIRQLQDPATGGFTHVLNATDLSVKDPFRIIYYDGEAAFGLMRLYGLTQDDRWLAVVEKAFEYFIAKQHWKAHDHWLSYCVNELTLYRPEERYYRFGIQNVAGYLAFVEERITTFPTLLELMMAAHKMITRLQQQAEYRHLLDLIDLKRFYHALETRAHYLLNGHFWPEYAMYFQNPQRIVGSFFIRHHSFRVRIDDVEHYLSGFVAYLQHYLNADSVQAQLKGAPVGKIRPEPRSLTTNSIAARCFVSADNWKAIDIQQATPGEWLKRPSSVNWRATGLSFTQLTMAPGHMAVVRAEEGKLGVPALLLDRLPYKPQLLLTQSPSNKTLLDAHSVPVYQVADLNEAVLDLGRYARRQLTGKVIGVTGSAGKTSSISLLQALLNPWGQVGATTHSANLPHGIAWTLASVPWQASFQIIEMAIGRMRQNAALTRPDVAVFLNAGPSHLEYHKTVENVAVRKSRIFEGMQPGAYAVINRDMDAWPTVSAAAEKYGLNILSFGQHPEADIRWLNPEQKTVLQIELDGSLIKVGYKGQGSHWVMNLLAALGVLNALKLPVQASLPFIDRAVIPEGRGGERLVSWQTGDITVLNDAYNANPLSMSAMLARVAGIASPGHKHLVLADMRELGPDSYRYHQALVEPIVDSGAQAVWLLGEQMYTVAEALKPHIERVAHFADTPSLETALKAELRAGDWVAFKGSNKFGLSQLAKTLAE
ncbi:UDP-N-acetylmuramoyl-tripeptide--D-alanyl-D-alanine ligase [Vreelandella zhanjiangensis]|uniref:UDP-N-acetylmuramoyl-tripeptide--D-alanyl-D- alanine ligase n=1 Tax=Vreelandella zhanjiangensis TaxID=1121960 RepID=UPI00036A0D31|nr:UDP-N-acetylmuramoyl-tripeptide--D-alanyl-D-alanine ligase [Halomonas zhanjiangensis]